jgi:hypothetical protein
MKKRAASFHRHVRAHEAVIANEYWYGDGPPLMHPSLSAAKTAERQAKVVDLLEKAASKSNALGDRKKYRLLKRLAKKLDRCRRGDRCGSLACPQCARAFQRAKAAAQEQVFLGSTSKLPDSNSDPANRVLVMVTLIPLQLRYAPGNLVKLDIAKRTRWLKDMLTKAGLTRMMVGSADIGWEYRRSQHYYQLHWHLAMWTEDPEKLQKQLLRCFPPKKKYDRPVELSKSFSLGFLPYMNKAIKLPDLLRRNRQHLPQLLLALDRTAPLDLMVICGLRLSAQSGRLALRPSAKASHEPNSRRIEKHVKSPEGSIWRPFKHGKPGNHQQCSTQLIPARTSPAGWRVKLANFLLSTEH